MARIILKNSKTGEIEANFPLEVWRENIFSDSRNRSNGQVAAEISGQKELEEMALDAEIEGNALLLTPTKRLSMWQIPR